MQRARFLNKEKVIERLSRLATKAKIKNRNIKKIILFGSIVNNTYTPRSDADILIILSESASRFMDRIPEFLYLFVDAPIPVDVFPYTEKESQTLPLAKKAISEGIILA
jgi:predicted nucleotidyltransferase